MKNFEKIAIIGASVRFPFADTLEDLDKIYSEKIDCIHDITEKRIRLNGLDKNKKYTQFGYLEGLEYFDYNFFKISKAEAECIDPQNRIMLELACGAIESAGYSLSSLNGTNTAIVVGAGRSDYFLLFDDETGYASTGTMVDALAGRISYQLDLQGESSIVSTACSSSLYAMYDACIKLNAHVCDSVLVGGVLLYFDVFEDNANTDDVSTIGLASKAGRCRTFDARADGINLCEGAGCVYIKRYDDAVRDNDNILAVITGVGANQDGGRSNSFTAPSTAAQAELFERVWRESGIDPEQIGYYEAHGTGTKIGDPIEIESITRAYRSFTDKKHICPVGSLKTNYAHAGSAAGIAGILKGIVSINKKKKYPLQDLREPNPMIDFDNAPVYPISELEEWNDDKRIYAVNGFGSSGTNVHIVMENCDNSHKVQSSRSDEYIVTVSVKDPDQLDIYKKNISKSISDDLDIGDICYVLNSARDDYKYRSSRVVRNKEELVSFLNEKSEIESNVPSKLVFICSGDKIYSNEEIEKLCERYPSFKEKFMEFSSYTENRQAISAAVDAALICLYKKWGFEPAYIMGTQAGNASVALASGKITPDKLEETVNEKSALSFDESKFIKYMTSLKQAESDELICIDFSGEGQMFTALKNNGGFRLFPAYHEMSALHTLSSLYLLGYDINWNGFYEKNSYNKVFLATYPFKKTEAWPEHIKMKTGSNEYTYEKKESTEEIMDLKSFLRDLWEKALGTESISDDDNFFDLGANSLVSMSIIKKIRERTGVELDFEDLYDYATVNDLYDHIISCMPEENNSGKADNAANGEIPKVTRHNDMNVSGNQGRMLYMIDNTPNKAIYNMPIVYRITGKLDEKAFCESISEIIDRHEILHTIYSKKNGNYYQTVLKDYDFNVEVVDASGMSDADIAGLIEKESGRCFDLYTEISERIILIKKSSELYYWFMNIHHIAADGWSMGIFTSEFNTLYNSKIRGQKYSLPELRIQYADYSEYEVSMRESSEMKKQIEYWRNELEGVKGILDFPTVNKRPAVQQYHGSIYKFMIDRELVDSAEKFSRKNNMSLFMLLESAYAVLLHKYTGEDDICIGAPIHNRNSDDVKQVIGFFANTIVIRSRFRKNETVIEFLNSNKKMINDAFTNSVVSLEEVVKNIRFRRDPAYSPLFQHTFAMQNFSGGDIELEGISISSADSSATSVKFDIAFMAYATENGIEGNIEYDTDLFTAEYIKDIFYNYKYILKYMIDNCDSDIDMISIANEAVTASDDPFDSLF